ncbi:MAG: extracellular solute-binding protein [Eubacteriales bacterium]|nr:extracellular solute-binding protein [Eubacteriales bacterium]
MKRNDRFFKKLTAFCIVFLIILTAFSITGCEKASEEVIIYTSVDQLYSEKIFADFEEETGIKVKAVYDIEASKTVGLVNRLISEKDNPQADVFWNGEILQTLVLKENEVLEKFHPSAAEGLPDSFKDSEGYWYGFGGRARVLIYNKDLISEEALPKTIEALASGDNVVKTGIAYPIFGTTSTHAAVLYAFWGELKARQYFTGLYENGVIVLDGNGPVKDYVSQKKLFMGMTDTDDALSEMEVNDSLDILLPDQGEGGMGTLVIPNSVVRIKGGPNPGQADIFIEYLLSPETEQKLVNDNWIHIPVHEGVNPPPQLSGDKIKIMDADFQEAFKMLEKSNSDLTSIFIR